MPVIQVDNARQILRRRLIAIGVSVATAVGVVTWFSESERIDDKVLSLALDAARRIDPGGIERAAHAPETAEALLMPVAREIAADHFGIVELYDRNKRRLIEYVPPELEDLEADLKEGNHVALGAEPAYLKRLVRERFALVVAVPIGRAGEAPVGYFEGVFLPDPQILAQIREDVVRTVVLVVLAILLTTLTVYPVVLLLHREVLRRSREILRGNLELLGVLGSAIAKRDSDTNAHNYRVTRYAIALGERLGIPDAQMRNLIAGAFLHDVGKIGIPDRILLKPGRLDPEEFTLMQTHVTLGLDILKSSTWLRQASEVVACHHEKYDGSGYVQGLRGEAIPQNARIFAVVDVFDALTSQRPYKAAMPPAEALAIMRPERGRHFDPLILDAFLPLAENLYAQCCAADEEALRQQLMPALERYFIEGASA